MRSVGGNDRNENSILPTMGFPLDDYAQIQLPDYDGECWKLTLCLIGLGLFWLVVFPVAVSQPNAKKEPQVALTTSVSTLFFFLGSFFGALLFLSPYNYYLPRRVFQVPLLTPNECQHVLELAHRAAQINYEQSRHNASSPFQQEPLGWHKTRHGAYPTTDLNLVTDPFDDARDWLKDRLDQRLGPLVSRLYGIPIASIRANDLFVVRYDAERQAKLRMHTDSGAISVNILLNTEFEGGGTRFWDRTTEEPFAYVQPTRPGMGLLHSSQIDHEGRPVT